MQPTTSIRCAAAGSPRTTGRIVRPPTLWPIGSAARKTARSRTYEAYVCTGRRGPVSFSRPNRIGGPQNERPAVRAICFTILVRQVRIDPLQRVRGRRLRLLRIRAEELCRARGRLQSVALRARLVGDAVEVPDLVRQGVHREDILALVHDERHAADEEDEDCELEPHVTKIGNGRLRVDGFSGHENLAAPTDPTRSVGEGAGGEAVGPTARVGKCRVTARPRRLAARSP